MKIKNRLHQLLLTLIIDRIMKSSDKIPYKQAFNSFDINYNGSVIKAELLASILLFERLPELWCIEYSKLRDDFIAAKNEIDHIFHQIDIDKTQELSFTGEARHSKTIIKFFIEFLTVAMDRTLLLSQANILTTFKFLDLVNIFYYEFPNLHV